MLCNLRRFLGGGILTDLSIQTAMFATDLGSSRWIGSWIRRLAQVVHQVVGSGIERSAQVVVPLAMMVEVTKRIFQKRTKKASTRLLRTQKSCVQIFRRHRFLSLRGRLHSPWGEDFRLLIPTTACIWSIVAIVARLCLRIVPIGWSIDAPSAEPCASFVLHHFVTKGRLAAARSPQTTPPPFFLILFFQPSFPDYAFSGVQVLCVEFSFHNTPPQWT